ncbi:MAG: hypothetical protein WCA41_16565, partial [Candidatus Acidiferrum sp.]
VEQSLVGVLQIAEKGVFVEGSRLPGQCTQPAINLFIEISDVRWKQTVELEYVSFAIGECCSFIETGGIDQVVSGKRDLKAFIAGVRRQLLEHFRPSQIRTFFVSV